MRDGKGFVHTAYFCSQNNFERVIQIDLIHEKKIKFILYCIIMISSRCWITCYAMYIRKNIRR